MSSWQKKLEEKVKSYLEGYSAPHDFFHMIRVKNYSLKIQQQVGGDRDILVAAALLHDVGYKGHERDHKVHYKWSMELASKWLPEVGFPKEKIEQVLLAIRYHDNMVWDRDGVKLENLEAKIIQDADRVEALGAVGLARLVYYYGEKGYPIYNDDPVRESDEVWLDHDLVDQLRRDALKKWEHMNFEETKQMYRERHEYLEKFRNKLVDELKEHHGLEDRI